MNLDNIVIILDRPGESRNIGSACRAMANCSIHALRIVGHGSGLRVENRVPGGDVNPYLGISAIIAGEPWSRTSRRMVPKSAIRCPRTQHDS